MHKTPDPENSRKARRFFRKQGMFHPVYIAFLEGTALAQEGRLLPPRLWRNPYPPGRRREEFERGFATADLRGDRSEPRSPDYERAAIANAYRERT